MRTDRSEPSTIGASLAVGTLSGAVLLALPGLVGVLKVGYGFSDSQLGYLSSAALGGLTVGSACAARFIPTIGLSRLTQLGLLVAAAGNGLAALSTAFGLLLFFGTVASCAAGLVLGACYVVLGQSKNVDRSFAFWLIAQLLFAAAMLQCMPAIAATVGVAGVFGVLAVLFAFSLFLIQFLPSSTGNKTGMVRHVPADPAAWMGLVALVIYFTAQGAVWPYLELIGRSDGLGVQTVASSAAASTLAGIAGPMAVAVMGSRFGRVAPSFAGLCIGLSALYIFGTSLNDVRFAAAACLFSVAWNLSPPYQMGSIAAVDGSGRLVGWAAPASLAGMALGPLVSVPALRAAGFRGVLVLSAGLCILSFIAFIPAWRKATAAHVPAPSVRGT